MTNKLISPTKQEFGRRLSELMTSKSWSQSELSRQAGLPRDFISSYINGRTLPNEASLSKLATALDIAPDELLPSSNSKAGKKSASIAFQADAGGRTGWLQVDRLVQLSTLAKIIDLLNADTTTN